GGGAGGGPGRGAARFSPARAGRPGAVLVPGGTAGDGRLDELTGHGSAVGAEAARRSARIADARRLAVPTRAHPAADPPGGREPARREPAPAPVPAPELPVYPPPQPFLGRTPGFVAFSAAVSS